MPQTLDTQFDGLIQATDRLLWDAYRSAVSSVHQAGKLIFPKTSKGKVRVSEQEAKQLLIQNVRNSMFSYSVETPTVGNYGFSGVGERNAMTDLSLYANGVRFVNMEFKSGTTSIKRKNLGKITKDMKKLVLEEVKGFWFHTLGATNRASIASLWKTIRQELRAVVQATPAFRAKQFTFHCCVLREAFSVQTTFQLNELSRDPEWLCNLTPPMFRVSKGQVIELSDANDWQVFRCGQPVETVTMEAH